jgi:hypothetical protein
MKGRLAEVGDLFKPVLLQKSRFKLKPLAADVK